MLGKTDITDIENNWSFFRKSIKISNQRGNAARLLGTLRIDMDADEFFDALYFYFSLPFSLLEIF